MTPPRILLPILAALLAMPLPSEAARGETPSGHPSATEVQSLRFEKALLGSQLELAKRGTPYFQLDPWSGRLELVVGGVVVSRFPAEKCLVGGGLRKLLQRKDPASPIVRPFDWLALDHHAGGGAETSLSLRLKPPLRIEFEGSPSNFFWRWLRFQIQDLFGGMGKRDAGMSLVLFYHPDSLATLTPLLDDSLAVLLSPGGIGAAPGR